MKGDELSLGFFTNFETNFWNFALKFPFNIVTNLNPLLLLCAKFGWNLPCGSELVDFQLFPTVHNFTILLLSPLRNRAWLFIWTNLNPLHPRMLCTMFDWNWPSGSEEEVQSLKSLQTNWLEQTKALDKQQVIRKAHLSVHSCDVKFYQQPYCCLFKLIHLNVKS